MQIVALPMKSIQMPQLFPLLRQELLEDNHLLLWLVLLNALRKTISFHCQSPILSQPCDVVTCAPPGMHLHLQAVYTSLREAEYRSTAFVPYWNIPLLRAIVPRQRRCTEALKIINATLDGLIQRCKDLVEEEEQEFVEEFVGQQDPSILHFLLASGDQVGPDTTLWSHLTALVRATMQSSEICMFALQQ